MKVQALQPRQNAPEKDSLASIPAYRCGSQLVHLKIDKRQWRMVLAAAHASLFGKEMMRAHFLPNRVSESGERRWRSVVAINVLVVDDEENVRELLVDVLRANGYCASSVESGRDALQMLRMMDYDVVVTDLHMPSMNGLDLMSEVRNQHPGTKTILMTAEAWPEIAREARRRGALDVIYKPFKYQQLLTVMKRSIRQHGKGSKSRRRGHVAPE